MMKYSLLLLFTVYCLLFTAGHVSGQHFTSPSFNIDWGNFNITSGHKDSTNYRLTDTVGQNAPGQYDSSGYIINSGFQYIYDTFNQLSFSIDNLNIELGTLVAGVASTATNTLTISTPSGRGYQILARYNHPLTAINSGITLPNTKCDFGTCTPSQSEVWTSTSSYGFGFNALGINSSGVATGVGTSSFFTDNTYFRPFSDTNQVFATENFPVINHRSKITYKTVISGAQAAGFYQNSIIYTAVPKY